MVHSNSISSLLSKQMTKCLQLNVSAEKNWFRWLGKISSNLQYEWTYVRFLEGGGGQVWMCTGLVRKRGSIFNGGEGDIRKSHFWRRSAWQLVWGHKARTMSILPSYLWVWLRVDCLNTFMVAMRSPGISCSRWSLVVSVWWAIASIIGNIVLAIDAREDFAYSFACYFGRRSVFVLVIVDGIWRP